MTKLRHRHSPAGIAQRLLAPRVGDGFGIHEDGPSFTSDRRIVFTRDADDEEVYVIDADDSGETNLTNNPADDSTPDF